MTETAGRRSKKERDYIFACINELASPKVYDDMVRKNVAEGRARWCLPSDLKRLGFDEYLAEVPLAVRKMYEDLEKGEIGAVTEPYMGFWQAASDLMGRRFLGILLSDAGRDFDYRAALASITQDANKGLMFDDDREDIVRRRPVARVVAGVFLIAALVCGWIVWRKEKNGKNEEEAGAYES